MSRSALTQAELQASLHYAPSTGIFTWRRNAGSRLRAGEIAGRVTRGRIVIYVGGALRSASRLAVLYITGSFPAGIVDHINGDSTDNRWSNLRDTTQHVNMQNLHRAKRSNTSSGLLGVSWDNRRNKWYARITANGRVKNLGYFADKHEAHAQYLRAKRELHEGCTI